jgi:hypothetical protein
MKHTLIFLIWLTCSQWARGQTTVPLSLISNSGGTGQATVGGTAATVEWTLGETLINAGTAGSRSITIGQQQPLITPNTGISESVFQSLKIYPNPAASYVTIENMPQGKKNLTLSDAAGKTILETATRDNRFTIQVQSLAAGMYQLHIALNSKQTHTAKIIISNH